MLRSCLRLRSIILRTVCRPRNVAPSVLRVNGFATREAEGRYVQLGGVRAPCGHAFDSGIVLRGYAPPSIRGPLQGHLRWMLQKDRVLHQDFMLVGPPGPGRRHAVLAYAELAARAIEFVVITPDTTESDLKQRREIRDGSVVFTDQAPVRAAISGALLVVEGLERAERNVLPLLNNLLENREMALEDGRFLCSPQRWAALLAAGETAAELERRRLVPVHPAFRVCAISLPVPPYSGRALDPPLRSRFSARFIPLEAPSAAEAGLGASRESNVTRFVAAVLALRGEDGDHEAAATTPSDGASRDVRGAASHAAVVPQVDAPALASALFQLQHFPGLSSRALPGLLHRALPYFFLPEFAARPSPLAATTRASPPTPPAKPIDVFRTRLTGELGALLDGLVAGQDDRRVTEPESFVLRHAAASSPCGRNGEAVFEPASSPTAATLQWAPVPVALGGLAHARWGWTRDIESSANGFESTEPLEAVLAAMVVSHAAGRDILLLGPPGK